MPTKVLIIGKVWPEPGSSAAGSRMMQIIDLFQNEGWDITFVTAATHSQYAADLEAYGVQVESIKLNDSSFDAFLKRQNPNVVMFDRFMTEEQFGWRVRDNVPEAMTILDTEDLHFLREGRQTAWKEGRDFREEDLYSDMAKRELASIHRCDISLIISEFEMGVLKETFGVSSDKIVHVPFLLDAISENEINNWKPYGKREHFVSIGNFLHEPNWNAVLFLKEEIWHLIRERLPDAELHIYGAYPSQKVKQLHNESEGFMIKGRADDAKKVVEGSRVLLAPLRFGAGLKGKLIEAMQCGTPSVTTPIGAEAMHGKLIWPGAISDDPKDLADQAVELYTNEKRWHEAQCLGTDIINRLYQKELHGKRLIKRLIQTKLNLLGHRRHHFTGEILHYHTLGSARYMSKWIEAKNKDQ
ncbi:glycosyltransferase [Gracilimonas amylolytica]|uniref:glycosyltransferase n=1 Tax=Gracilimonas amylolytica TaxID=1749045 RepID=UPI000CD9ED70|nr:glycosyltransferase family 4 protein [Gracilimonas amylolytica]